ncbi:acetyl-CoA synthetase-like protein [Hesseltinella vesiculosa]|uniref:Acetyl-CoA synthetase-like protein n=1 Tax=Hesseltinella vesiculosa TaxID=101127 RepID=A0A1X2GCJ2_9FUNG|nr:acetyl-CoA synthetase-like protein [Hesseltinella vesiculosa]
MSTLHAIFENHLNDKTAIVVPRSCKVPCRISYRQLYQLIQDFACQLQNAMTGAGRQPGQAVAIAYPNSIEFVVGFLGAGLMQLVAAPLNPAYTKDEFIFYLDDSKASVLIVPPGSIRQHTPAVQAAHERNVQVLELFFDGQRLHLTPNRPLSAAAPVRFSPKPQDVTLLLHTSGTTGRPKGVPLSHVNLATSMKNIVSTYELNAKDCTLLVMPLFHVHGLICGLLASLYSGASVVIPEKFSASQFWSDFGDNQCNWYTAVPTIHQILLRQPPRHVPHIRFIRSCSSSLAPATLHALEATFKAPVLEAYAMTEAAHQMTSNPLPKHGAHKPGSVGLGQGVEVVILNDKGAPVDEGEVCIKGSNVTRGYLNNPTATAEAFTQDGYFRTGDQGKKDKDGYLILTGRIKELINRGGEKISPLEVDAALLAHPNVAEAVCFGVPDDMYGQEVHAAIVLKSGSTSEKDLQDFVVKKLAKFKVPKRIYFTNQLPKTGTGKIQRRKMVDVFFKPQPLQAKL